MEVDGADSFRIRSYRNAASAIESHPEPISQIIANPERSVTEIPGIGKGIASVLGEIEQRGSFERRDEMLVKYPPTALELLHIQGLGPRVSACCSITIVVRASTIWNGCAASRNFATCRAWARSWKRKCCDRSSRTASVRDGICSISRQALPRN